MDYQTGEYQNSPYSFNVTPTNLRSKLFYKVEDYG
jgi:hypothetical protein